MLLYLRHGDDRGDDVYQHDRRLSGRGAKKAAKKAEQLIEKYGHPDIIFVSPFRRGTDTLEAMTRHFTRPVDVRTESRIGQQLSRKQQEKRSVRPETLRLITIPESEDAFRERVESHAGLAIRIARGGQSVWCITHQAVIEEAAPHFGIRLDGKLGFLDHVVMLG